MKIAIAGTGYVGLSSAILLRSIMKLRKWSLTPFLSEVVVWGTGTPRREFLYSDDMADACMFLMNLPSEKFAPLLAHDSLPPLINIGYGKDITIRELADIIRGIVGFKGEIIMDISKPDGTLQKLLDVGRLNTLGWRAATEIKQGITMAYDNFLGQ